MNKPIKNKSASVRQLLLNKSKITGKTFNELLQYYAMERWLYRLSCSEYKNNFILKGALLFTALNIDISRSTKDIDFQGRMDNNPENIEKVMKSICTQQVEDDGIIFDNNTVKVEPIVKDSTYQGVRSIIHGTLGTAKISIQIDIGFGDIITPEPSTAIYPAILDFSMPEIRTYTLETVIAEKLEAMIKLGTLNSRLKDFFDIWLLSKKFSFNGNILSQAINATFNHRETKIIIDPVAWTKEFALDHSRQLQWNSFIKKKRVEEIPDSFEKITDDIKHFLYPVLFSLKNNQQFNKEWKNGFWIE